MFKNKHSKVAVLSLSGRAIKLLSAPLTILIISKQLSSEELAFYYTFFSLLSMQQLAELGIGHVIKQYISHSFKNDILVSENRYKINSYYKFSQKWFLGVGIFILIIVGCIGFLYFSYKNTDVNWEAPWFFVILSTFFATLIVPCQILLESLQKQEIIFKARLVSSLCGTFSLLISLWFDLGLYSISISSFISSLSIIIIINSTYIRIKSKIMDIEGDTFKNVFLKIFPLLSKVSVVWGLGFLFWNSFNLVSFSIFNPYFSGKIIFAVALAKAGFGIAESVTQGQVTIYSNYIANDKINEARNIFRKYSQYSMLLLITGYITFFIIWYLKPDFYVFSKIPDYTIVAQIFLFFTIQLYKMLRTNFVRCFKVEPFLLPSIFEACSLPIVFYIAAYYIPNYMFLFSSLVIIIGTIWSFVIERDFFKVNKLNY